MIIERKNKGIKVADVYFELPKDKKIYKYACLNCYSLEKIHDELMQEYVTVYYYRQHTLINSLLLHDDDILMKCDSGTRYEIRRAKRDGIKCYQYKGNEIDYEMITQFEDCYSEMHKQKGIAHESVINNITHLNEHGNIIISFAVNNMEKVVYHVYLADDSKVRLLYSASTYRNIINSETRNSVGRANRLLHYEDMIYFRNNGFEEYDFGGVSLNKETHGIDEFKMGFGGRLVERYNVKFVRKGIMILLYKLCQKNGS